MIVQGEEIAPGEGTVLEGGMTVPEEDLIVPEEEEVQEDTVGLGRNSDLLVTV
jgi:hypothetical protein